MPELPEVEILVRHLDPVLRGKRVRAVCVLRPRVIRPSSAAKLQASLRGAKFTAVRRRGKYLVFELSRSRNQPVQLLGHLGMTGRFFVSRKDQPTPKHTSLFFDLGPERLVFEDTRYFGRLTLDLTPLAKLGPEPLGEEFTSAALAENLKRSRQPIKTKLLDQAVVAGVGNIYASEALFRAGIAPSLPARKLKQRQIVRLVRSIRRVLTEAVRCGSTIPLNVTGPAQADRLFYFGQASGTSAFYEERLRVYDRANQPCGHCGAPIRRIVQAARSTFFCPRCQRA